MTFVRKDKSIAYNNEKDESPCRLSSLWFRIFADSRTEFCLFVVVTFGVQEILDDAIELDRG